MNRKDLEMYIDLIINEEDEKANALIAKIMSEETKKAYRDMLIEDGDLNIDAPESTEEVIDTPVEPAEVDTTEVDTSGTPECDSVSAANSQFVDLHKDIERLKKLFNKIQDGDDTTVDDTSVAVEEDGAVPADGEASPLTFANESEENIFNESLELSAVKTDGTSEKEVGNGGKVSIDKTSTINSDKSREKKGTPINIKSSGDVAPNGGLQKAPEVKPSTIKSTNVMDLKTVPEDGDSSAELNSKAGFGSDDSDSPLSDIKID